MPDTSIIEEYKRRSSFSPNTEQENENNGSVSVDSSSTYKLPTLERSYITPPSQSLPKNRKATKRKVSTFSLVLILVGTAVVVVFYISNVLSVNHLMRQINACQVKHQQMVDEQELLRAQVNKLSSFERIQKIGEYQLGLTFPKESPIPLQIDRDRISEAEQLLRQLGQEQNDE
ncbi:MAG TPA: septum formation initiator family protein [Bacteroidota bacterium]|jgi:cell division protein FtsB|nr:septum formation initiator family protein [Bacteroidota bacterium]